MLCPPWLVQAAQLLSAMGDKSATFLAFNVKIKDELNDRLPAGYSAINSHSLGNRLLKTVNKSTRVDYKKWQTLCEQVVNDLHFRTEETYNARRMLESLCSKVMLTQTDPKDIDAVLAVAEHFRIGSEDDPARTHRIASVVDRTISKAISIWEKTGEINFDEMIYLPVVKQLQPPQFKWVFTDECQDLNILQQEIAFRSCAPGGRMIFVGDVRQAIYGFAGADTVGFQRIIERTSAKVLPLNVCYRCPSTHIELAKALVPELEAAPNAKTGVIEYAKAENLHTLVTKGSLVMCRLNAPLMSAYFQLIQHQVVARVMGKDIAKDLVTTLKRIADFDGFRYERMIEYLEKYREQQLVMLQQKSRAESQIEILHDKVDCLIVCVENFKAVTLQGLIDALEDLFMDDDKDDWSKVVALCTVHKAKGLEANETFILRPEKMPLTWPGQHGWEYSQELNIKYVALTRAKQRLVIVGGDFEPLPKPETALPKQDLSALTIETIPAPALPAPSPVGEKVEVSAATPEPVTPFEKSFTNFLSAKPGETPKPPTAAPKPEPAPLPEIKTVEVKQLPLLPPAAPEVDRVTSMARAMSVDELKKMIGLLQAVVVEKEMVN